MPNRCLRLVQNSPNNISRNSCRRAVLETSPGRTDGCRRRRQPHAQKNGRRKETNGARARAATPPRTDAFQKLTRPCYATAARAATPVASHAATRGALRRDGAAVHVRRTPPGRSLGAAPGQPDGDTARPRTVRRRCTRRPGVRPCDRSAGSCSHFFDGERQAALAVGDSPTWSAAIPFGLS